MNDFNLKDNKVIIVIISIIIIIFLCVFFYTRSNLENEYTELDNYLTIYFLNFLQTSKSLNYYRSYALKI